MEVSIIFKIAAVGIVVSILNQILKHNGRDDQAALTALAGLLIVIYWILPYILELFTTMKKLFERGWYILMCCRFQCVQLQV